MFVLILDLVEDFHTVEVRRLHRIFGGLEWYERINPDSDDRSPISKAIMDRIVHNTHAASKMRESAALLS